MGRAILAISGSAIALLPRPFTAAIGSIFAGLWRELTRDVVRPYRPELHYMRGPGPAWRAKHGAHPRGLKPPILSVAPCPKVARPGTFRAQ